MKPFIHGYWHAWQGAAGILLSDESRKKLRQFPTVDDAVNWLFLNGERPAARGLNAHAKG